MKIAITGHLNGIGKSCYELLSHKGHNVIGFDVEDSSGDIAKDRDDIILKANNCEVFINNAFTMSGAQIDMFNQIYEKWKDDTYKMSPDSVALYVAWVLEQPDDIEVLDVAVRRKPHEDR